MMNIETTVNIAAEAVSRLDRASTAVGIPRSRVIVSLLRRLVRLGGVEARICASVRYQRAVPGGEWACVHLCLRDDEYEWIVDMRKLFKVSVSGIVAMAIERYLDDLVSGVGGSSADNYLLRNYLLAKEYVGGVICWKLYWGFPPPEALIAAGAGCAATSS